MKFRKKKKKVISEKARLINKKFSIVLLVWGIIVIPQVITDLNLTSKSTVDINNISEGEIKAGAYVQSSIQYVLDYCAIGNHVHKRYSIEYEDKDMERYYILPMFAEEKTYYMLLEVGNNDRDYNAIEELVAANWSYIMGETEEIQAPPISLESEVKGIDSELMGYMRDWFVETDFLDLEEGEELESYLLPYKVTFNDDTLESIHRLRNGCITFIAIGLIGIYIYRDPRKGIPEQEEL